MHPVPSGGPISVGGPTSRFTVVHANNNDKYFVMFASLNVVAIRVFFKVFLQSFVGDNADK